MSTPALQAALIASCSDCVIPEAWQSLPRLIFITTLFVGLFIAYWRANKMPSTVSADVPDPLSPSTFTGSI